jgi:D-alanine-D-alanine ligase
MKIAVLLGGTSSERKVSLASGMAIAQALDNLKHEVILLDPAYGKNQKIESIDYVGLMPPELDELKKLPAEQGKALFELVELITKQKFDIVFNALHGGIGENGVMQSLFEAARIKYTGSRVMASALAMNKVTSKQVFLSCGVPTAEFLFYRKGADFNVASKEILSKFTFPLVVKPNEEGSTVGLTIVKTEDELAQAWNKATAYGDILVERYIAGRELTVTVVGEKALPVIEIIPEGGFYDYEHKYTKGKTNYVCPAEIPSEISDEAKKYAVKAFKGLMCSAYARIDFRLSEKNELFCLEVNTLPGMTATSLVPKAAKAEGMEFEELIQKIVTLSMGGN